MTAIKALFFIFFHGADEENEKGLGADIIVRIKYRVAEPLETES